MRAWILLCLLIALPGLTLASVGKIIIASGEVYALDASNTARELRRRSDVFEGDTLVTGADGSLQIRFNDNAILALNEESRLKISHYQTSQSGQNESVLMDLLSGGFRTITGSIGRTDRDAYQVRTPNASIGIRGTHYEAALTSDALLVGVYQGGVRLSNAFGQLDLGQGSAFLYGRVMHQAVPRGLVNPPPELRRQRTSSAAPIAQADEAVSARQDDESDDIPPDQLATEAPGVRESIRPGQAGFETAPLFSLSLLEQDAAAQLEALLDDNGIDQPPASGDLRLSNQQIEQLNSNPRLGYIVLNDGDDDSVHFVYMVDGDNGPVFINFESQLLSELDDGYKTPDNVFKGPEQVDPETLIVHELGDETISWGQWNASPTDNAKLYTDPDSPDHSSVVESSFFYVSAAPSKEVPLIGTLNFNLNCSSGSSCIIANRTVDQIEGSLAAYGNLNLDLSSGTGSGYLDITTVNPQAPASPDYWYLYFEGNLVKAQFFGYLPEGNESSVFIGAENASYDLSGQVDGLIVGGPGNFSVTGGFGVKTDDDEHSLSGLFLMEQGDSSTITGDGF